MARMFLHRKTFLEVMQGEAPEDNSLFYMKVRTHLLKKRPPTPGGEDGQEENSRPTNVNISGAVGAPCVQVPMDSAS